MKPTAARRAAYDQAKAAGCTCRPDIAYRPSGMVDVRHDADCPLVDAGQTAVVVAGGVMPVAVDLTGAIDLALRGDVMVMGAAEAVVIVPDTVDVPPMIAEFCDITRIARNGRSVAVCSISDEMAAHMLRQGRGTL